ncbi:MAG: trypsin-like serine protease, partial [Pseudomonadota bacterium]
DALMSTVGQSIEFTQVLLDNVYCGGSYLGDRWVATAAHCVTDFSGRLSQLPGEIRVTVGINDLGSAQSRNEAIAVERIEFNPSFRSDAAGIPRGDWALVRLVAEPINGNPIQIATAVDLNAAKQRGGDVTVIGWGGQLAYGPGTAIPTPPSTVLPSSSLRHAVIQLADTATCNAGFQRFNDVYQNGDRSVLAVIGDEEICHANRQTFRENVCHGDSGGPSVITVNGAPHLVGATSWGPGPGCAFGFDGSYAVSASLTHFAATLSGITGQQLLGTAGLVTPSASSASSGGGSVAWWAIVLLWAHRALRRRETIAR